MCVGIIRKIIESTCKLTVYFCRSPMQVSYLIKRRRIATFAPQKFLFLLNLCVIWWLWEDVSYLKILVAHGGQLTSELLLHNDPILTYQGNRAHKYRPVSHFKIVQKCGGNWKQNNKMASLKDPNFVIFTNFRLQPLNHGLLKSSSETAFFLSVFHKGARNDFVFTTVSCTLCVKLKYWWNNKHLVQILTDKNNTVILLIVRIFLCRQGAVKDTTQLDKCFLLCFS